MADWEQQQKTGQESKPYVLIGFMGSGKSSLGRAVAAGLERPFADLDSLIEAEAGCTISELFASRGEPFFRELEASVLRKAVAAAVPGSLLAAGGGAPCFHQNMDFLLAHSHTLYLQVSPRELSRRLLPARQHRPLLAGLSEEQLLAWVENRLRDRQAFYQQAAFTLTGDQLLAEDLIQWIRWHESGFLH